MALEGRTTMWNGVPSGSFTRSVRKSGRAERAFSKATRTIAGLLPSILNGNLWRHDCGLDPRET